MTMIEWVLALAAVFGVNGFFLAVWAACKVRELQRRVEVSDWYLGRGLTPPEPPSECKPAPRQRRSMLDD